MSGFSLPDTILDGFPKRPAGELCPGCKKVRGCVGAVGGPYYCLPCWEERRKGTKV